MFKHNCVFPTQKFVSLLRGKTTYIKIILRNNRYILTYSQTTIKNNENIICLQFALQKMSNQSVQLTLESKLLYIRKCIKVIETQFVPTAVLKWSQKSHSTAQYRVFF